MISRHGWTILAVLLLGACTTKFKEPQDSDAEGDVLPDGVDGDAEGVEAPDDGPGDADADDPVPDVPCTVNEDCSYLGAGYLCCDRVCVDGASDTGHCGQCDIACGDGESCCDGSCLNTRGDPMHCGSCTTICELGSACRDGGCVTCTAETIQWDGGNRCYNESRLGRFSHYSVLAPIFDGRLDRVPDASSPLHNPPLFGVLTVDNVPVESADTLRDYVVEVRRWGPDGNVDAVFLKEYAGSGRGILALDALHLPRPDAPGSFFVTLGGMRTTDMAPRSDSFYIDTVDIVPDPPHAESFVRDVEGPEVGMPGVYWQLPVPFEAALSLAGIDGGAVVGVGSLGEASNSPIAAVKRPPPAGDAELAWPGMGNAYAYASHVAVENGRIFVLVTDDRNNNPDSPDWNVLLYCFLASGIDLGAAEPVMDRRCWTAVPYVEIANNGTMTELGLGLAAGADGTAFVLYEENADAYQYKVVRIDGEGAVGTFTTLALPPGKRMGVSALLVDFVRSFVYVVGYHYDDNNLNNFSKTPAIWKLSSGLGVIGDFGTNGRRDYDEGFFSDALLLCDGSILAKSYSDAWDLAVDDHTDDRICLVRYNGVTGEPF